MCTHTRIHTTTHAYSKRSSKWQEGKELCCFKMLCMSNQDLRAGHSRTEVTVGIWAEDPGKVGCCEPNQSSLRMSDQHTPLGLHSQPAPKPASVEQGAGGRCGCVLMCLWVSISVYIPKQMRVCLGLCCLLSARLNTPTLFPHELCSPEWVLNTSLSSSV